MRPAPGSKSRLGIWQGPARVGLARRPASPLCRNRNRTRPRGTEWRGSGRTRRVFLETGPALPRRRWSISWGRRSAARQGEGGTLPFFNRRAFTRLCEATRHDPPWTQNFPPPHFLSCRRLAQSFWRCPSPRELANQCRLESRGRWTYGRQTSRGPKAKPTFSDGRRGPTATIERILQEITAVSHRIEGMDTSISSLTLETKSIRTDIAGFHSRVMGLESRVETLETHMSTTQDRDQDLSYLRSKVTDLEDRSRRDNIRRLGIPENDDGTDVQTFFSSTIPKLTSLAFEPPLEFQRAHRVGPKCQDMVLRHRPIIACLLRHSQTRQILQAAQTHGPFRMDNLEVRITADYSKDTTEYRKAFLSLRPRLCQLEVKYRLFDPARMWITKNGITRDFYNPEDLRLFLVSLQTQTKQTAVPNWSQDTMEEDGHTPSPGPEKGNMDRHDPATCPRGQDLERLTRAHDDRGQATDNRIWQKMKNVSHVVAA
ncbi:hypothetical protein NDU88_005510 [Pleurodeles waltl]|uniref:Uncharacterized protein n=1 Tax=Pleurodeles waltl TaxID=8319 RepID=A0AAV7WUX0_PLEWA|nr:hypothetical protein NDU88_005510 [Pleurodeles waltl]